AISCAIRSAPSRPRCARTSWSWCARSSRWSCAGASDARPARATLDRSLGPEGRMIGGVGRRGFMALLAGAGVSSARAAWAQPSAQLRRVAVLFPFDAQDPEARNRVRGFRLGLRDLDWVEGRNVTVEYRFAGGARESIERNAAELVAWKPEVIVTFSTPA